MNTAVSSVSSSHTELVVLDWEKCVLCQRNTSETLQCPAHSKRKDLGSGYESLGTNVKQFQQLGRLPFKTVLASLDDDARGLTQKMKDNNAKWHKSCKDQFSNLKLQRAEKRGTESADSHGTKKAARRSHSTKSTPQSFFCEGSSGELHRASTFNLDANVRRCAFQLNDTLLLAKLSAGDMVAIDAMYHTKCLTSLYKRAENVDKADQEAMIEAMHHGIALAELTAFIEESQNDSLAPSIFMLADLANMYVSRLE